MGRTIRWLAAIAAGLLFLAVCVAIAAFVLPWDTATNVATGAAAGVVVGAFLPVWVGALIERSGPDPEVSEARDTEADTLRQRAGDESMLFSQSGRFKIKNQLVTHLTQAAPSQPQPTTPPVDGVVPPKG